mmetsp:Transcript_53241/g.159397  ORF Transcript_53241/g.159397 Transcript_53241/m.159397 type:complete len:82 (+) Transcript_53241:292-537(+)
MVMIGVSVFGVYVGGGYGFLFFGGVGEDRFSGWNNSKCETHFFTLQSRNFASSCASFMINDIFCACVKFIRLNMLALGCCN